MAVTWDANTDYMKLINEAKAAGNSAAAARYEQQRNAKIAATNSSYAPTYEYTAPTSAYGDPGGARQPGSFGSATGTTGGGATSRPSSSGSSTGSRPTTSPTVTQPTLQDDYISNTDFGKLILAGMGSGASADYIKGLLDQRVNKASGSENLNQYAYDDIYNQAMAYIANNSAQPGMSNIGNYNSFVSSGGYDQVTAAQKAAMEEYLKMMEAQYALQKQNVGQSAAEMARQAYLSYMQSKRNLPQQLAASGYSGGMADSHKIALDAALQGNQNDIALNKYNTLNEIDTAIAGAKSQSQIELAQQQAALAQLALQNWNDYRNNQDSYAFQDFWNQKNLGLQQQELDQRKQQMEFDQKYQTNQAAYQNALSTWSTLGYANEYVASILGVPVGTSTADASYNNAYLAIQKAKG